MRIFIEIWILNICVIDYLLTEAKPFLNQCHFSSIYIQHINASETSETALYNRLQNMKKHYQIRWFDDQFDLLTRRVYKNKKDITAFDLWIWGYMKLNVLVSNFVLLMINLHWTLICCISKRDTCNEFGVKICACRAKTKKCDINEKKYLKYKVNGSQCITIWIDLGLKGLFFIEICYIVSKKNW